jgi:hypothetical protein
VRKTGAFDIDQPEGRAMRIRAKPKPSKTPRQSDSRPVRPPSLISRFERTNKSGDPFDVPQIVQAGGSESICDDAFPIATSITIIGLMKRLYLGFDVSWAQIGAALDISRQSGWERFT